MAPDRRWLYITAYVALWSAQAILIKNSQSRQTENVDDHQYPYEIMAMTLFIELFKITLSLTIFLFTSEESSSDIRTKSIILINKFPDGIYFIIPAAVYVMYNGLAFINLKLMEPGTYRILINTRIVFSGLLSQWFFKKWLRPRQWYGLVLLMLACVVEQSESFSPDDGLIAIAMMSVQGVCSSLGGVYFQWLLQHKDSSDMGIWLKNIYLYFWSIVFNLLAIIAFRPEILSNLLVGFDMHALAILVVAGLGGVCTSLVLRHLDVLIKEYANFAEMVVVAVIQRVMFGIPLRLTLVLAIIMVSYSLYLYQVPSKARQLSTEARLLDVKSVKS